MTEPLTPEELAELRAIIELAGEDATVGADRVARLLATLDALAAPEGPHPGEPHEFRTICRRCGEPGLINLSLITPNERVDIVARLAGEETP